MDTALDVMWMQSTIFILESKQNGFLFASGVILNCKSLKLGVK